MGLESTRARFLDLLAQIGRGALHSAFPDDIEYYLCSFELVNSQTGLTVESLVFPIMPNNITIRKSEVTDVEKTLSGVSVTANASFIPRDISIRGTFGRKMRILIRENVENVPAFFSRNEVGEVEFARNIKSGYGTMKLMQSMLERATSLAEDNVPLQLYFYNFAFNSHWLVEPMSTSFSQSEETRQIWTYSVDLKAVAPAEAAMLTINQTPVISELIGVDIIQSTLNDILDAIRGITIQEPVRHRAQTTEDNEEVIVPVAQPVLDIPGLYDRNTEVRRVLRYDIELLYTELEGFLSVDVNRIIAYYRGATEEAPEASFSRLNQLMREVRILLEKYNQNGAVFGNVGDWDTLDEIEDIYLKLQTVQNISRYLRSAILQNSWNRNPQFEYGLHQNQTLENVAEDVLLGNDSTNQWVDIAIKNDLEEEGYSSQGEVKLTLPASLEQTNFFLESVLDNIVDENAYGRDLQAQYEFVDDDLAVLAPRDTFKQAVDILLNLKKGDIPKFRNLGLEGLVGQSRNSFRAPAVIRQINETLDTDDTISSIQIVNIRREQDAFFVDLTINTFFNEVINQTVVV